MSRVPKALLPTGDKPLTAGDVGPLLKYLESHPLLSGTLVERVTIKDSTSTPGMQSFRHGLGRPYRHAIVVSQSTNAVLAVVFDPKEAKALGADPATHFGVVPLPFVATDLVCSFWVF